MYPETFSVTCREMGCNSKCSGACNNCSLPLFPGFKIDKIMTFHFVREIPKDKENNPFYLKVSEHDILGLVEVTDNQKVQQQKSLVKIHDRCRFVDIRDDKQQKLLHVVLSKDIN